MVGVPWEGRQVVSVLEVEVSAEVGVQEETVPTRPDGPREWRGRYVVVGELGGPSR